MKRINDLSTIRQAHRYVVAYQRRLLDALSSFNNQILDIGFRFDEWSSIHFDRPPSKTNAGIFTNWWAFDFTMLYSVEFYWDKGEENKPGFVTFWLQHLVDTGLEKIIEAADDEPDPLSFEDATKSDSILRCCWIAITGKKSPFGDEEWDNKEYGDLLSEHFKKDILATFHQIYKPHPLDEFEKKGVVFGQLAVSLEELPNPEAFNELFCNVIVERMKELSPPEMDED